LVFFFFQAEDGIRAFHVTGVQTCALPIFTSRSPCFTFTHSEWRGDFSRRSLAHSWAEARGVRAQSSAAVRAMSRFIGGKEFDDRSEERRVGKEWRSRWWREPEAIQVQVAW